MAERTLNINDRKLVPETFGIPVPCTNEFIDEIDKLDAAKTVAEAKASG